MGNPETRQIIRICSTSDNVNIAYATSGDGPPLLLAPGWFTHLQFNWDSPVWQHWNRALSRNNTLIRYDPRGCGLSDRDVADLSFAAWVRDLESVANALDLQQFPILGFCQGAAVAIAYTAMHPERVTRLVLYGSYPRGIYTTDNIDAIALAKGMQEMIRQGWGVDIPAYQELFAKLLMPEGKPEQLKWLCEQQQRSTSAATAAALFEVFQSFDVTQQAKQISQPALVAHQRNDSMIPFADGQKMAGLLPHARFVPLEGTNHMLTDAEPAWRQFISAVDEFLIEDRPLIDEYPGLKSLTRRESTILEKIACGLSNEEISDELFLSIKTVRNHITNIFSKLDVQRRSQAIVLAREAGYGRKNRFS